MTWEKLVYQMKTETYGWDLEFGRTSVAVIDKGFAWPLGQDASEVVRTDLTEPYAALKDLLDKCRSKWPKKNPLDDMTFDELMRDAWSRGWFANISCVAPYFIVTWPQEYPKPPFTRVARPLMVDALRDAMKAREERCCAAG